MQTSGETALPSPAVRMTGVVKRFGTAQVLRGLELQAAAGEMFALVGINGAGKTTCMKSLLDFASIDSGRIEIHGTSHLLSAARHDLYFLPERFIPPYFLTGRDFLKYSATLHGVVFDAQMVAAKVAALELDEVALGRPVRQYSKGMAQKLGLAAAFASGKSLLVLDEPMSGLDPKARILVKRQLLAERKAGRTVFLTTHMLADVQALCDRMAVLHGGRVVFAGAPDECLSTFGGDDLEHAFLNCLSTAPDPTRQFLPTN
jgi:ABC-2 type transport system ATP-binding protein